MKYHILKFLECFYKYESVAFYLNLHTLSTVYLCNFHLWVKTAFISSQVIPYWSDALIHRVLPPNSTIIHIDAHPDDSLPSFLPNFPDFKLPRTEVEVASMVQHNDRFIRVSPIIQSFSISNWKLILIGYHEVGEWMKFCIQQFRTDMFVIFNC